MKELGELLKALAKCVECPIVFGDGNWPRVTYPAHANVANIIAANVREFGRLLAEARERCLSIGLEETIETREMLAYATAEWEDFSEEWLDALRMADGEAVFGENYSALEVVEQSCERIAEGCLIPLRRLAAKWIAAGDSPTEEKNPVPPLGPEWIDQYELNRSKGIKVSSLNTMRSNGWKAADGQSGKDSSGRWWRRDPDEAKRIWYLPED